MKWIGQHIWSLISRFRSDVYLEDLSTSSETNVLVVDSNGKVSKNTSAGTGTTFVLEDGDGTEVTIAHGKEVKFVEGNPGIDINWTDTDNGTDADPYDLSFSNTVYGTHHGYTDIWLPPSDFMSSKSAIIYDTGGVIDNTASAVLYVFAIIPSGATATHVHIYGNDTSDVVVYQKAFNAATETSKGTGNVGTNIDITDVTGGDNVYLAIKVTPGDQDTTRIYGGKITLTT